VSASYQDAKSQAVLRAITRKIRPYRDRDVAVASHLSLSTVRLRLQLLRDAGLIRERWVEGQYEPFWELGPDEHYLG
jgi:hypothetical protein